MNLKLVFLVVTLVALSPVAASFWDSIPLISQIKSGIQIVCGDAAGAKRTQINFINQAPIISQGKSIVNLIQGDHDEAKRTQEQFLHGFVEPVVDNTPVVGHIKGAIHIAVGDEERGQQIIRGATVSTAAVAGAFVGGPTGAIGAASAADGLITTVDSAVNEKYTPYGIVDYVSRIDEHSSGEHVDTWLGIGGQFAGGKAGKKRRTKVKQVGKVVHNTKQALGKKSLGEFPSDNIPLLEKELRRPSGWQSLSDDFPAVATVHGSARGKKPLSELNPDNIPLLEKESLGSSSWEHLSEVNDPVVKTVYGSGRPQRRYPSPVDIPMDEIEQLSSSRSQQLSDSSLVRREYANPDDLKTARAKSGMERAYAEKLQPIDFQMVNDVGGSHNCYACSLAALKGKSVSVLSYEMELMIEANGAPDVQYIIRLYRSAGFKKTKLIFGGSPEEFGYFLSDHIRNGHTQYFTMPYRFLDGSGHVVLAKAWKTEEGYLYFMATDFQQDPFSGRRFSTSLPDNVKEVYVIYDREFDRLMGPQ